ncbi:MAG: hypothetical protein K1X64_16635 [Myxococcaceae bacterium]|nr:hypothetical protein [Myxococcaceae bacterium]
MGVDQAAGKGNKAVTTTANKIRDLADVVADNADAAGEIGNSTKEVIEAAHEHLDEHAAKAFKHQKPGLIQRVSDSIESKVPPRVINRVAVGGGGLGVGAALYGYDDKVTTATVSAREAWADMSKENVSQAVGDAAAVVDSSARLAQGGVTMLEGGTKLIETAVIKSSERVRDEAKKKIGVALAKVVAKRSAQLAGSALPLANTTMLASDAASMYSTCSNPKASKTQCAASVVTFIGSAAAETGIPLLSQVGVGVSAAGAIAGTLLE